MKFDSVIMNPPYGSKKTSLGPDFHFLFVDKCLQLSDKEIVVMPIQMYKSSNVKFNERKEQYKKYLVSVEEVDSKYFLDTAMMNVGIYVFDNNKKTNDEPKMFFERNTQPRNFISDYEEEIFKYLKNDEIKKMRAHFQNPGKLLKNDKQILFNKCNSLLNRFKDKNVYLTCNIANGGMNAKFISNSLGKIFDNVQDLANDWYKRNGSGMALLIFNSKKAAENCKIALQNPVLRLGLYRLQDDQNMHGRVYKYVPNIDWSDDRVKIDEGLLEVCGCPKDKAKEYADYCKKIIDDVDKM